MRLPHFYLLERHKTDHVFWPEHPDIIFHLENAVREGRKHGLRFSDTCQESTDRFLTAIGRPPLFTSSQSDIREFHTPEELAAGIWPAMLYGQRIKCDFAEEYMANYVRNRLADFDAAEDLSPHGLPAIGLGYLSLPCSFSSSD